MKNINGMKKPVIRFLKYAIIFLISTFTINTQVVFAEEEFNIEIWEIYIITPENTTYADVDIILSCEFNREVSQSSYSIDGKENVTFNKDVIIPDLSTGEHRLIVYAKDQFGNTGVSEIVVFNIKPFPSFLVIISISLVGFIGLSLLIHSMRQKNGKED